MRKKGELTTQQIVTIIILIVSFAVILFFLSRLNLGETSNKQICHNSVLLKSKTKGFGGPLDCRTNYLCISGGGKCETIDPTGTIKVNPDKKGEIMEAIAKEMADCWWMFGEGKIDYVAFFDGETKIIEKNVVCGVCSIVEFDPVIQRKQEEITYKELIKHLEKNKRGEENYLKYLYDIPSWDKIGAIKDNECNFVEEISAHLVPLLDRKAYHCNRVKNSDLYGLNLNDENEKIPLNTKYKITTGQLERGALGQLSEAEIDVQRKKVVGKEGIRKNHQLYVHFSEVERTTVCESFVTKA